MSKGLELLQVVIFFFLYKFFNIFIATIGLVITTISLAVLEYIKTKKLAKLTILNLSILLFMSSITIFLEDASFIKMKPAIIYLSLGCFLLIDLFFIKKFFIANIYKAMLKQDGIVLNNTILKNITVHWIILLFVLAFVNELIWRVLGENLWVYFKVFLVPLSLVLMIIGHVIYIRQRSINVIQ